MPSTALLCCTLTPDRHLDVDAGHLGPEHLAREDETNRELLGQSNNPRTGPPFPLPLSPFPDVIEGRECERPIQRPRVEMRPAEPLGNQAGRRALP